MVELQLWSEGDFSLLEKLNSPEQTKYVGGPETPEQIFKRHRRYIETASVGKIGMFKIRLKSKMIDVGFVGYWEINWRGQNVYETGWGILPEFQRQGFAGRATALLIDVLKSEGQYQFLHAFPAIANFSSNAICKKLGFLLAGECEVEYPPGKIMICNDWRFSLFC